MKKVYETTDTQMFNHADMRVHLQLDKLSGGWYAYGVIYAMPTAEQSLSDVKHYWRITKPQSWGFGSRAEAAKARTQIKKEIAARIDAEDFEGNFFKYV